MQTSTFALLAVAGAATAAVYATDPCNLSDIKGKLLTNGTTWYDSCTTATHVDVFLLSTFPTLAQAKNISQTRDCVNYINQINQQANSLIGCETTVGDQTINFGELLTDLLKGQTGNKTKEVVVGSDSMSNSVSYSSSASTSGSSEAGSTNATTSITKKTNSSSSASAADKQESGKSAAAGSSAGVAVTATFSVVAAAVTTVLAFAL
ncbi:hypothetical protein PF005_g20530 [Phytophthora fragariae]|uniref:Elicitin n=1 Tax=Phytophthora fragariae TaxID=53985 RepID=A0A6A3T9N9_9STRA|nr:hypothetical protein PF003_g11821 [Phytophthora fragariae]KAE8928288.1 hypothetical protein PF009_g21567 [Phytophthora fragariae]KAE8987529.1 hypothetical protein PF011_g19546 [Phytophthora fragariae]KAE9113449.1 hypothetical protein PF006_g19739 [Phytophthora fragariae]KAE9132397.1 hypothetical protein PF007_g3740 [Phytophthora fragariae]